MAAIFELKQLAKYAWQQDRKPQTLYLFEQISAEVLQPQCIALIGASGQGKSTLLRTLALLESPDEGDILYKGTSFRSQDIRWWRQQVCYVPQQAIMLPGSVEDNLRTVSRLHGEPYEEELATRLLEDAMFDGLDMTKQAKDLSGGEKQRIALIRSLMLRPKVLLLDEVTASLDSVSARAVEQMLLQWHIHEGTTLIWITHDLEQASRTSNRIWFMSGGTLLEDRLTADFFNQPATEAGRQFVRFRNRGEEQ
ncbi:phosphate ABC transporter ATP-binding protein [Paenibacillus sp. JCM 10914]|uniref:ABC transporter ATP-binding protein n=1 Tax=Paenibacillus sp. JCM 10914 TaxID=1236974 RepID=UPI0003CCB5F1|nr:ATP-binding cassette domain-containing protein [Paenibacillus sp. JCM 10914]GAE09176.1 YbbL ABC transporter ATP-binding protein [Paenibacillus sp. JCM 10914]